MASESTKIYPGPFPEGFFGTTRHLFFRRRNALDSKSIFHPTGLLYPESVGGYMSNE